MAFTPYASATFATASVTCWLVLPALISFVAASAAVNAARKTSAVGPVMGASAVGAGPVKGEMKEGRVA